jgi:outer membrane protein OmpA-like peptidoglycan-associated protein
MEDFMIKYRFLLIFCLVFIMIGCAGKKMALNKGQSDIDLTNKSIALLSVRISNQYKPGRQLELQSVVICPQSEPNCKHELPSNSGSSYKPYKREKDYFNEYLLKYELESGTYNIDGLYTTYRIPTLTSGVGFAKLNLTTEIKPNSISYLGHLDIILREKKNNAEISAGGNVPFIDQYIAGFSSGTFDIVVEDKFDEDMESFISEYPALQKVKVEKSILPQGIKPEKEAVVAAKVEEPATPKEVVVAPKEAIAATTAPAPVPTPTPAPVVIPPPPPSPKPVIIEKGRQTLDVKFDFDKSTIKKGYYKDINDLAGVMKQYPDLNVVIEGYTDSVGTSAYNKKLSQGRADAVKKYIVEEAGINAHRIKAQGFGKDKPIASNKTKKGRQQNRRVEAAVDYIIEK